MPKTYRPKMVRLSINLPQDLADFIRNESRSEGISMASWVRRALQWSLEENGYPESDWCWCLRQKNPCSKHSSSGV